MTLITETVAGVADAQPARRMSPSAILLLAANAAPLVGVLAMGWEVFPLVLLYWSENVIVGVFNVLRMLFVTPKNPIKWIGKFLAIPFFIFHYGMFTAVHGIFVFALFGGFENDIAMEGSFLPDPGLVWRTMVDQGLAFAAAALLLSHAFSSWWNYIRGGEYQRTSIDKLMQQPYARVIVLHIAIIGGGFLVMALGSPLAALTLLVVLKTIADFHAHTREHRKLTPTDGHANGR